MAMVIPAQLLRRTLQPPLIALLMLAASAHALDPIDDRQARLAAAYVFNFIKFVEWPAGSLGEEIHVCFSGAQDIQAALAEAVRDKPARERRVTVREVGRAADYSNCNVLYVDSTSTLKLPLTDESILTIGDSASFTANGGVVRLYVDDNRLRFVINVDHAKRARLQVSSNLLKLATRIEQAR